MLLLFIYVKLNFSANCGTACTVWYCLFYTRSSIGTAVNNSHHSKPLFWLWIADCEKRSGQILFVIDHELLVWLNLCVLMCHLIKLEHNFTSSLSTVHFNKPTNVAHIFIVTKQYTLRITHFVLAWLERNRHDGKAQKIATCFCVHITM